MGTYPGSALRKNLQGVREAEMEGRGLITNVLSWGVQPNPDSQFAREHTVHSRFFP